MCGIFAYSGDESAVPHLLAGLKAVEYRGYDSAGISVIDETDAIRTIKHGDHKASLSNLSKTATDSQLEGNCGIGHTRWATHGEVNDQNSHPHQSSDGNVSIAHNGIVENYIELKDSLASRGVEFSSETDSEVIAHYVGEAVSEGRSLREAVLETARIIRGNTAIVAVSSKKPGQIVGLRVGNAGGIVAGTGDGVSVMASDPIALLPHVSEVVYLEPGEVIEINKGTLSIFDLDGNEVSKTAVQLNQDFEAAQKGNHPHFMSKEIAEQPDAVHGSLRGRADFTRSQQTLPEFGLSEAAILKLNRVVLTGMGTSLHAAMFGAQVIESLARIPTTAENSSELRYRNPVLDKNTLVIAITQSGETADTLAAMESAREAGCPQAVVLEAEGTQATRVANFTLPVRVGQEIGVASTKTLVGSMTVLLQLAIVLAKARGEISREEEAGYVQNLAELPALVANVLDLEEQIKELSSWLCDFDDLLYLGRAAQLPIAMEGALKMKELAYIHAEGYAAGEMKHGVNALLGPDMATVVCAPQNGLNEKMVSNISEVKARGGEVLALATTGDTVIDRVADHVLYVPECPELLQPFATLIPLQMLAYHTALALGRDPDKPRNLAKTVTVE